MTFPCLGEMPFDVEPLIYIESSQYLFIRYLLLWTSISATLYTTQQSSLDLCIAMTFGYQLLSYEIASDTWLARLTYFSV